jgi:hypothetical protein
LSSFSSSLPLQVGRRVKVLFEDDQWFEGTATTSNKVTFDDGEISTLDATVRALYLLPCWWYYCVCCF